MSALDYALLALIGIWFAAAVLFLVRSHRRGGTCCGGASSCNGNCAGCGRCRCGRKPEKQKKK